MTDTTNMMPLMHDLSDKKIVVFGAGNVALRKVKLFSIYTDVTVVNLEFDDTFKQLSKDCQNTIELINTDLNALSDSEYFGLLLDSFLVIPATANHPLNERISILAKSSGALINKVDAVSEVIIPSIVKQGDMVVSIATNGSSPALSKYTRQKIEEVITDEYAAMAQLQKEMRQKYKITLLNEEERKSKLWEILQSKEIWQALSESYERALTLAQDV